MISKRALLGGAAALSCAAMANAAKLRGSIIETPGLRYLAGQHGRLYGAAVNTTQLASPAFAAALAHEAEILVPEYEMKRGVVEAVRGTLDFSACDQILAFAGANGAKFRGHTLVWHKRNPSWLEDAARTTRDQTLITTYIAKTVRHFRGRMHSWDVVNEAIAPADGRSDGLRRSFWIESFGPAYIDLAYHAARAADPGAMLVYNDWGCELGAPANDRFRAVTLDFLGGALKRGVPIDALGLQGHLSAFGTPVDQNKLRAFLTEVRAMGLRILVTEHDVDDSGGPGDTGVRDAAVAEASRRFLGTMIEGGATAVLTWGLSDRFLDPPGWRERLAGYSPRMLPLDGDLRRKPMWHALAAALTES